MSTRTNRIFIFGIVLASWVFQSPLLVIILGCRHARRATDAAIRAELYPRLSA